MAAVAYLPTRRTKGGDVAAVRYSAIKWAREVPTLLHRGRVDRLGHHLLLLLATYAKNDGSDMYASVTSLAKDARAPERDVVEVFDRLETAGLIERAHASNGAPGWSLNLSARSEEDPVLEDRKERERAATRARTAAWRERRKSSGDAEVERHVTQESGVTNGLVTPDLTVTDEGVTQECDGGDGEVARHNDDVTVQCDGGDARVTVTTAGQTPYNSLELPKDRTPKDELPPDADASGANEPALIGVTPVPKPANIDRGYTAQFEAFWTAYGKKGKKALAAGEWRKAVKRAAPDLIMARVGPYVASTPALRWRLDAERWLKHDCWESAVVPAGTSNGHAPFQDRPESDFDEGWGTA